ncbi:MAG TPA: FAD-binding oxidoreductase [Glaciihabitans sp.]|jgi:FAD/FMN-containing dehydrogenase|nr:FAD-binding oxidoreductase [Glaciihabitans sp.]
MTHNDLSELEASLDGTLISRENPDFDEARRVWNGLIDRTPLAVVRCTSTDDVVAAVNYAREHSLAVAVRGGGHSVAGHGTVNDGLVIDLSAMNHVGVDHTALTASVGGGATWGEVDALTQESGLAVPGGVFSRTGIGGLALGGGYGWIRNRYGLSCASIVGAEVVTASGTVVTATEEHHPDLLWALRGGGGNLGVVTRFTFRLHEVGPEVYFLAVFHDGRFGETHRGLRAFRDFCATAPTSVSALAFVGQVARDAEGFIEGSEGWPFIAFAALHVGDLQDGEEILRPLLEFGHPLFDGSGFIPYVSAQQFFDTEYPDGARYYWKSLNVPELSDEVIDFVADAGAAPASELSTIDIWHVAGAAAEPVNGAFSASAASFLINPEANWVSTTDDEANIAWTRNLVTALNPYSDGSRYLNFAGFQEEGDDIMRASFRDHYIRLAEIKAHWDPTNLFHLNQNIQPRATS